MITVDSASGNIYIPKVYDYQDFMDSLKSILNLNDDLFNYLYFSFIDEEEQERIRLNPQVFDDFIEKENPKLTIGFLDTVDKNIMEQFFDVIDSNKIKFKQKNYLFDESDMVIRKNDCNNNNDSNDIENKIILEEEIIENKEKEEEKEEEIILQRDNIDINKNIIEEKEDNNQNIKEDNFCLLDSSNKINNLEVKNNTNIIKENSNDNINNNNDNNKIINLNEIDNSEINLREFDENMNKDIYIEEKKLEEEDEFNKNIENIIISNIDKIKNEIIENIREQNSKINKSKKPKNNYIHKNYECNICKVSPIKGIRYHCLECLDYDLCEKCEEAFNHEHPLYKIKNEKSCKFLNENFN